MRSKLNLLIPLILIISFTLTACAETPAPNPTETLAPAPTATAQPTTAPQPEPTIAPTPETPAPAEENPLIEANTPLVISEVMAGETDFVELYNASSEPINLNGYSLIHQLGTDNADQPMFAFSEDFILPPYTHVLLGKEGESLNVEPDALFSVNLNVKTGGVGLYGPEGSLLDAVAWGNAPILFSEGTALPDLPADKSAERLPGGAEGNFTDSNANASDFSIGPPNPQNSAGAPTPLLPNRLDVQLNAPASVEPGDAYAYDFVVENLTGQDLSNLSLTLPLLYDTLSVENVSDGGEAGDTRITWQVDSLPAGEKISRSVTVLPPYTYGTYRISGYEVTADELPAPVLGPAVITRVEGGVIPINIARTLDGNRVTIEGVATMYTGGYFAGSGNGKFYLQDESGAIQVQMFDENGPVPEVEIGERVKVSGTVSVYRDSIQISPDSLPDDVEIIGPAEALPPLESNIAQATQNSAEAGYYVAIPGQITRLEEATYSYELDLLDNEGNTLFVYIDKLTNLTADNLDVGQAYLVSGILEFYQNRWELKPRLPEDFSQIYPPELRLEVSAPINAAPGETVEYTLTAYNDTANTLTNVIITNPLPGEVTAIADGGEQNEEAIAWLIPQLPSGENVSVHFSVMVNEGQSQLINSGYSARAAEWPEPVTGPPYITFVGQSVPIWAIQGPGFKTPYANQSLQTEGIVTAVFDPADIPGFFIQESIDDGNPATSAGLFINTGEAGADVSAGDLVQVKGKVKELSGQTQLFLESVTVLDSNLPLPPAVPLDPPAEIDQARAYYEAVEGMLVSANGIAVSPISKYGETSLVKEAHNLERVLRTGPTGLLITIDDGSWTSTHTDNASLPFSVTAGDTVQNVSGPLAYTFGQYKIEPLAPPAVTPGNFEREASLPALEPGQFSLATFNAENFFDNRDPNPADPPRPSRKEYQHKTLKIANAIAAMGYPTIIGLQEVENIDVLQAVAEEPILAAYAYQPVLIEGRDSRGIDVGYLVRGDQAEVKNVELRLDDGALFTRGPLLLESAIQTEGGPLTLYTLVNHFVSLGAGFETTEPRRIAQAQWNLDIANEILAQDPQAHIAILGDLNTFYDAPSIDLLREAGFVHAFEQLPPEERYTYIFEGASQVLDHILLTPNLAGLMTGVDILHINADFPPPIPDDESQQRSSDHDPAVVRFRGN